MSQLLWCNYSIRMADGKKSNKLANTRQWSTRDRLAGSPVRALSSHRSRPPGAIAGMSAGQDTPDRFHSLRCDGCERHHYRLVLRIFQTVGYDSLPHEFSLFTSTLFSALFFIFIVFFQLLFWTISFRYRLVKKSFHGDRDLFYTSFVLPKRIF